MRRIVLLLAVLASAACEATAPFVPVDGGALAGPWQSTPFSLAGPILQAVDQACRGSMPEFPQQTQLTVVDARGGGLIQAHYTSPDGAEATCVDMTVNAAGRVEALGGGGTGFAGHALPPLEANELSSAGGMGSDRSTVTYGRAGAGISQVVVLMPGHVPIRASLANGWYLVWWPGEWAQGSKVVGFDVLGEQVAETTAP